MDLKIRPYRHPSDLEELRRMFLLATNTGPGSPVLECESRIQPYVVAARLALVTTAFAFTVPLFKPVFRAANLPPVIFHCAAGFLSVISFSILWYVQRYRRRTERFFNDFRNEALNGDFHDIIARWGLLMQEKAATCVPNGANGFWVAEVGGEVTGCVGLRKHYHDHTVGEVGRLLVSPRHQGKGIATELMAVVTAHARANGMKRLELVTTYFNLTAIEMYTKKGWKQSGEFIYGTFALPVLGKDLD